jgi:serine/threonine protein kinase
VERLTEKYSLEREIGSGSTARVFLGREIRTGRRVAVKILRVSLAGEGGGHFRREARTVTGFSHPNIIRVYEVGEAAFAEQTACYVVMEYVPDGDLSSLIKRRRRLSERAAARIGGDVAAGLAYAHEEGAVHRDVKPQNVLLDGSGRAKLTDFTTVRGATPDPGTFSGTPRYAAPEQFGGYAGPESDVYSLGISLYQAVVGGLPFKGDRRSVARQHASETPVPPGERVWISERLNALILCCLEKSPARRPGAAELERELRLISERATVQAVAGNRLRWWIRRHRAL